MDFRSFSPSAEQALGRFDQFTSENAVLERLLLKRRAALCPYEITLVAPDGLGLDRAKFTKDAQAVVSLHQAWQCICNKAIEPSGHQDAWRSVMRLGEVVFLPKLWYQVKETDRITLQPEPRVLRFREDSTGSRFFIMLKGDEQFGIPPYYIDFLSNMWQLEQGNLPIHAAAVVRRGMLFLFAGPSGAGKSTAMSLSKEENGQVLDEDQVLIHRLENGEGFTADAWGRDVVSCKIPLRAIFALIQAGEDRLTSLRQIQVAQLLIERHIEIMGTDLPVNLLRRSLSNASAIARRVPGYDLHFRKSPNFWKLIDEQVLG